MSATASGDIAPTRTTDAPACCSTDRVSCTAGPPAPVRAVNTHNTATPGRVVASDRSANSVPLSAQWMSSKTIASGVSAAAAAIASAKSCTTQKRRSAQQSQRLGVCDRRIRAQGRHEQREKRYRLLILERLTEQGAHPALVGQHQHLGQQPTLANAGRALDDQHTPAPLRHRLNQRADHLQLACPPPNRRSDQPLTTD